MRYMGGKTRQAAKIAEVVTALRQDRTCYVEPFIGGGSVFSAVAHLFDTAVAGDVVPELIEMWSAVHRGWVPPTTMDLPTWETLKQDPWPSAMKGWAAYAASYNGKYFAGYGPTASGRDYLAESQRGVIRKASAFPTTAQFVCCDYADHVVGPETVVYCDPPYADTTDYSGAGVFDSDRFWRTAEGWAAKGALVLVHEYTAPEGWTAVFTSDRVETMNHAAASSGVRKEVLFMRQMPSDQRKEGPVSAGTFFSKPEYPDREPSRPKAVNPRTGREQSWTRASNFAASLDNPHALIKWSNRNAIMGLSTRPDLAAMALAGALRDDVAKVDEVIAAAHATMATDANANLGTAAHAAITRAWQHPDETVPEPYVPIVAAFAAALKEHGLTIKAAAQKVMNLAYNSLGEFDLVLTEADGTDVIGDMKSGKLEHAKRKFAVQLAMYDGAEYLVQPDNSVVPMPYSLAHSHGVLLHLDLENNTVSVYRIDLRVGRYGAGLAEQIRQWHTLDPLSPYVSPVTPRKMHHTQVDETAAVAKQLATDGPDFIVHQDGAVEQRNPAVPEIDHVAVAGEDVPEQSATERFDELMKLDKAPLQMLLKNTFGWTDNAHNRRWLARAVVALEQGLTGRDVVKYAQEKGPVSEPMTAPEAAQAVAEADAERAAGPSTATLLEAIAGAHSEGAIDALRKDVVERRGDQAWTDELVTAARARVLELLGSMGNAVGAEERALAQIASANSQAELKEVWDRVTLGNTVPENWTQKLTDAGLARLDEIKRATPPPPANPFA